MNPPAPIATDPMSRLAAARERYAALGVRENRSSASGSDAAGMTAAEKKQRRKQLEHITELFDQVVKKGAIAEAPARSVAEALIELAGMVDLELRWAYGTRSERWHLVGPDDRDYASAITQDQMQRLGREAAKAKYVGPSVTGRADEVVEQQASTTSGPMFDDCPSAIHGPLSDLVDAARDARNWHEKWLGSHSYDPGSEEYIDTDRMAQRMGRHALTIVRAAEELRSVDAGGLGTADCIEYAERAAPGLKPVVRDAERLLAFHLDDDGNAPEVFGLPGGVSESDYEPQANALAHAATDMLIALSTAPGDAESSRASTEEEGPTSRRTDVLEIPLGDLRTDLDRFQPREDAYAEETAQRIFEHYDRQQLDPIRVWKDPDESTNGAPAWYVLAGHSRLEGQRRRREAGLPDSESLPAIPFEGTEAEAIAFAHTENDSGTSLTNAERAQHIRTLRETTDLTLEEIKERAKTLYGRDHTTVIALSYLNPRGKALSTLRQLTGNSTGELRDAETMAVWIGKLRRYNEQLTDSHENEIYSWLLENYKTKGRKITSFAEFREHVEKVIGRRSFMGEFDNTQPLNFGDVPERSRQDLQIDRQLREARAELKAAQKALEEKRQWALETYDDISREQLRIVLEEENDAVTIAQREVLRLSDEAGRALSRSEQSLFDVLRENPQIRNCAIVTENEGVSGIEVRFPEDPGEKTRRLLSEAGFLFYTPKSAPAFWAATDTPARRAVAARLDQTGTFPAMRENPEAFVGADLHSLGMLVYLGRARELDTTAGYYQSRGIEDDYLFADAEGKQLLVVPPEYVERVPQQEHDPAAEDLYERWHGFDADETDYRITLPDAELLPAGHAEWIIYESDKIIRPGDQEGAHHLYWHEFDPRERPVMTVGGAILISNLEINRRGILN